MWPRAIEMTLAVWLWMSPFIFGHSKSIWFMLNDFAAGFLIFLIASLAIRIRFMHFVQLIVSAWLILFAYFAGGYPAPPYLQNDIITGIILMVFAIVPTDCLDLPQAWTEFYRKKSIIEISKKREDLKHVHRQ